MSKYLYNGIELPALPEWDRDVYPYAVISNSSSGDYRLHACQQRPAPRPAVDSDTSYIYFGEYAYKPLYAKCKSPFSEWSDLSEGFGYCSNSIFWTDTDIYNTDGTLYLAASDPVPVGGEVEPDPITTPVNGYKVKNGAGVKQDTYKRVGSQWVKQPQEGYEMVESVWQPIFEKVEEPTGEPIAYLYNGVQLPPLPEWDKEAYPYAFITYLADAAGIDEKYAGCIFGQIVFCSGQFTVKSDGYAYTENVDEKAYNFATGALAVDLDVTEGEWTFGEETHVDDMVLDAYMLLWSSYDILNEDGSVYLAASDPVPVYE